MQYLKKRYVSVFQIFTSTTCIRDTGQRCERTIRRRHIFALSRDPPLKKRAVVRYRLSRYSQPANLKSEQGNFLLGSPFSFISLVSLCIGSRWVSRLLCSLVYLARRLPPSRLRFVLYVFLKVDKPDRKLARREFPGEIRACPSFVRAT